MGRSLIQTVNQSEQAVAVNGIFSLGTVVRRYGRDLRLSGNGIEADGSGYFSVTVSVSISPTAEGPVTVALYDNGVQVPGAIAYATGTAGAPVNLAIVATIRRGCCCAGADNLTLVLIEGPGNQQNVSLRVVEE